MPLEPNATCPICGAHVYFWKNAAGSKVWFDALGPPWPKHPCLDLRHATNAEHHAFIEYVRLNTNPVLPALKQAPKESNLGLLVVAFFLTCCPGSLLFSAVSAVAGEEAIVTNVVGALVVVATFVAISIVGVRGLIRFFDGDTEADDALTLARNDRPRE